MPSDWLFHWLTRPTGLLAIAFGIGLGFLLWRLALGKSRATIGYKPLALAYLAAAVGLAICTFVWSHIEFSSRVAKGLLPETDRWAIVSGWTVYGSVLLLIVALPLLGFIGAPLAGLLARFHRLTPVAALLISIAVWLVLSVGMWVMPSNQWAETHRFEALVSILSSVLPGVALVGLPFLLVLAKFVKLSPNAET